MVLRILACRTDMFSASSHHGKVFWVSALWLSVSSSFREEISETLRKVKSTGYAHDLVPFFNWCTGECQIALLVRCRGSVLNCVETLQE